MAETYQDTRGFLGIDWRAALTDGLVSSLALLIVVLALLPLIGESS